MNYARLVWIIFAATTLLVFLGIGAGMMGNTMGPGMMWGPYEHASPAWTNGWYGPAMMGLGWLIMLGFWALLGVGLFLLIRAAGGQASQPRSEPDALEILRRRYAAGEIDEATYEHQREKLAA